MRPIVYSTDGGPWTQIAPYLAEGTKCPLVPTSAGLVPDTVGLFWGLLRGSPELIWESLKRNQPWIYLDHGYFRRGHFHGHYRMTWCDFQQRELIERPDDRWKKLNIELQPWRKGRDIIVCPPSSHVCKIFGCHEWEANTTASLRRFTARPIRIRRKTDPSPFAEAIRNAHAVVTSSSIAAVEAALLGVPVFVDAISAASLIGLTDLSKIESPVYPDREPWVHSMAYGQFTRDEMKEGLAWRVLSESLRSMTP